MLGKSAMVGKECRAPMGKGGGELESVRRPNAVGGAKLRRRSELSSVELDELKPSASSEQCFVAFGQGKIPGPVGGPRALRAA